MAAASLAVDSYALASLLSDAVAATCDFDGVLLGDTRVRRSARITDDTDRPAEEESRVAVLRGHFCATSVLSFYDAAGCVDEDALVRLLRAADGTPLLGWFVARRASPLTPSAREMEVWRQLQRRAARLGSPPPLFGLVCSDQPADGEPFSTQYVVFAPPEAPLQPPTALAVSVLNVGSAAPARRAPEAPALPAGWHKLLDGAGLPGTDAAAPWRALEAAAALGAEQTRASFEAALERAKALCLELERADDALHASRERARRNAAEHEVEETLSDDEALAAEAVELPDVAPQPTYEPPPELLAGATVPVGGPSILDEILAGEPSSASRTV